MHVSHNYPAGKRKYLYALLLCALICVICAAFSEAGDSGFDIARREILLRRIGHELLLQSGDSTSRVLPVKKIAENEYQIRFENDFDFQPDSLMNTARRLLAKDRLAGDYVVNVLNCGSSNVTYGFAISGNEKNTIVACSGRKQPRACYMINIQFEPKGLISEKSGYLLGGLPLIALVGFLFVRSFKPKRATPAAPQTEMFTLGSILFDAKGRKLMLGQDTTDLTGTETRLLLIFATAPNQVIERSRLQKEIWEDEGVIVGRSLDMFISKLRKKLEIGADLKIAVVRGIGYRLEVG